jgi:hydroxymethylbilane synthase
MTKGHWIIGTRGSPLALKQTEIVVSLLEEHFPGLRFSVRIIATKGDTVWDRPLHLVGGKGLFVKEIEEALLAGVIDLAVHSVKDLPTDVDEGLSVPAVLPREDPRDAFLSLHHATISDLHDGGRIGTSSLRRKSQLLYHNRNLTVVPLRGNVDTRVRKLEREGLDAVILALAGVKRMGLEEYVREILPFSIMVPPSGQGAIGIETKRDGEAQALVEVLNDACTFTEITLERHLQALTGGGCQVPLGINAALEAGTVTLNVALGKEDGTMLFKDSRRFPLKEEKEQLSVIADLLKGGESRK